MGSTYKDLNFEGVEVEKPVIYFRRTGYEQVWQLARRFKEFAIIADVLDPEESLLIEVSDLLTDYRSVTEMEVLAWVARHS
jgi:hypothetical protein